MCFIRQTFIILLCAAALLSCESRRIDRQLLHAEALMQQNPDSAFTVLRSIDGSQLSGELQARHALLLSQAFDKNYIDLTDDSLINIAYDYYRNSPDDRRLMQAAYYKAVIAQNDKKYLQSMSYAAISDTLSARLGDHKFIGLSASLMLFNCMHMFCSQSEIDFGYKARQHFLLANDIKNTNLISRQLAHGLISANRFNDAIAIIDSINDEHAQTELRAYLYCVMQQNNKVDSILNILPYLHNKSWLCSYRAKNIIEAGGDLNKAKQLLGHAIKNAKVITDTTIYIWTSSRLAKAEGRFQEYIKGEEWYERRLEVKNWRYQQMMVPHAYTEGFALVRERDTNKFLQAKRNLKTNLYISLCAAFCLTLFILFLLQAQARRKAEFKQIIFALQAEHSKHSNSLANELEEIANEREAMQIKYCELRTKIQRANQKQNLHERINVLLSLSDLYRYANTKDEQKDIGIQVKNLISKLSDKTFLKSLQQLINNHYNGLIDKIQQIPSMRESDMEILTYFYSGLSVNLISVITGKTQNHVTVTRHRIKEKLIAAGIGPEFLCKPLERIKNS